MNFKELENQFWQLKGKQSAGAVSEEEFKSAVANLRLQDEHQQWWTINPVDGTWLTYQNNQWQKGSPPTEQPDLPPPPPGVEELRTKSESKAKSKINNIEDEVPEVPTARPRPKRKTKPRADDPKPAPDPISEPKASPKSRVSSPKSTSPPIHQSTHQRDEVPTPPPPKPRNVLCTNCKSEIFKGDKFCGDCGQNIGPKTQDPGPRTRDKTEEARPKVSPEPRVSSSQSTDPLIRQSTDPQSQGRSPESHNPRSEAPKSRYVKRSWIIGGLIYIIITTALMLLEEELYNKVFGTYGLYIADVLAAIIIFSFVLTKNGIKTKFKTVGSPGKDMIFLAVFGLCFVLATQLIGANIAVFISAFLVELGLSMEGMGLVYAYIILSYLMFVLFGILLSIPGIKIARRVILKEKVNKS